MAFFPTRKPNVKALARRKDVDALVAAAGFQDLISAPGGGLFDRGATVRQEAILSLGAIGADVGPEAVQAGLRDPADGVRVAAIRVLFSRRDAVALATALAWLPAELGHSRPLAIRALLDLRSPECAPALTDALVRASGDSPIGDDVASLLKVLLDPEDGAETATEVVNQLLAALASEQDSVADRAEELLAMIEPLSTEGLIAELEGGTAPHRAAAALAQVKDNRALEPLIDGLLHHDPRVRAECAGALGELRDPAAVEALIHASRDPEDHVRSQASWALDRLGMVALMVGASTRLRPIVLAAVGDLAARAALPETVNGASANDGSSGRAAIDSEVEADELLSDLTSLEAFERLLAEVDDVGGMGDV